MRLVSEFYEPGPNEVVLRFAPGWEERFTELVPLPDGVTLEDVRELGAKMRAHVEAARRNGRRDPDDCWDELT